MLSKPRHYQLTADRAVIEALREYQSVLYQAPCGSGKTFQGALWASRARSTLFIVHQLELIEQTSKAYKGYGLEHGIIAGSRPIKRERIMLAMVNSLVSRLHLFESGQLHMPSLVIVDECHRACSPTYKEVIRYFKDKGAKIIGLTATPERTDGKPLSEVFEHLVEGPDIRQLIAEGFLSDYRILTSESAAVDLSSLKLKGGDFDPRSADNAYNRPSVTGDAIEHYRKHAYGKRIVVMCNTINHARDVAEAYRRAGIPAECIEGTLHKHDRQDMLERFRRGETLILTNVQLLIEGVDIPAIWGVQWLRPTMSLIVYIQALMRSMRPYPGKTHAIILDHVGNAARHGLPDQPRAWSLDGREKARKKPAEKLPRVARCKSCDGDFSLPASECPYCGEPLRAQIRNGIEVVDGELVEVDKELIKKIRSNELKCARSMKALVDVFTRQGSPKPAAAAAARFAAREGRKPGPNDYIEARKWLNQSDSTNQKP